METIEETMLSESDAAAKNRSVAVEVKANELYPLRPNNANVDKCTRLLDDEGFGNKYGDRNLDFTTKVFMHHEMSWTVKLSDSSGKDKGYSVALNYVDHKAIEGNPNFFDSDRLNVKDKIISGKISKRPHPIEKEDEYTIHFTITPPMDVNNGEPKTFPLDPKLKIIGGGQ